MQRPYTENISIGQHFKCEQCGFEVAVVAPCLCEDGEPELKCCDESMSLGDPSNDE